MKQLMGKSLTSESINVISGIVNELKIKKLSLDKDKLELEKNLKERLNIHKSNTLQIKIKELKVKLLKAPRKQKKLLLREFFEKIVVIDEYEIKLIIKQASDSGAFLYDILIYNKRITNHEFDYLRNLYSKRHLSLRQVSIKVGCSRSKVRRILTDNGVELKSENKSYKDLVRKIERLRKLGSSYEQIAIKFNLWKVPTRSNSGIWYAKTIRELCF